MSPVVSVSFNQWKQSHVLQASCGYFKDYYKPKGDCFWGYQLHHLIRAEHFQGKPILKQVMLLETMLSSFVIFYSSKIVHLGFWKLSISTFLPIQCPWDKVEQLKYSVLMQDTPTDLHYYTSFQIMYSALFCYTRVGLQMLEHYDNSAFSSGWSFIHWFFFILSLWY